MGFAERVIGPATSGRIRWLHPSDALHLSHLGNVLAHFGGAVACPKMKL
jgi:hypothetical protein